MVSATTNVAPAWLPDDYGQLLIATASKMSVALQTTSVVQTTSNTFRIPLVDAEAPADWYDENADITLGDAGFDEEAVRPRKIAGLSKLSNELVDDSDPKTADVVGQSIARTIATGIDAALFGTATGLLVPPKGIGAFADADLTLVTAPAAWANADPFIEAQFAVEALGGNLSSFIANPADAQILAKLKKETGSNEPLLAPDATSPTTRRLAGVPLFTSVAIPAGTIYGIDSTRTFTVLNRNVAVELDRSVYFASYSTAVRSVARVAFAYAHPKSIARIELGA